jgi:hypothetical protein
VARDHVEVGVDQHRDIEAESLDAIRPAAAAGTRYCTMTWGGAADFLDSQRIPVGIGMPLYAETVFRNCSAFFSAGRITRRSKSAMSWSWLFSGA